MHPNDTCPDSPDPSEAGRSDVAVMGVTTTDLTAALEEALGPYSGGPRRVARIRREPADNWSSHKVELIDVHFEDGGHLPVFFKQLGRRGLVEAAAGIKPEFLDNPMREIATYREILDPLRLGTPACYGALINPSAGRYWLFLERVPGATLSQVGGFEAWLEAARWLGDFHARLAGDAERWRPVGPLILHDAAYFRGWLRRARDFLGSAREATPEQRRRLDWLATRYDSVVDVLTSLPTTIIHGEFYPSNLLVRMESGRVRICPVDWEMTAIGPGLIDLAALTTGRWTDAQRAALYEAYCNGHPPDVPRSPRPDTLPTLLAYGRIHLAVQWLGWSPRWVAPPEHQRDWLGEAVDLAEELCP
jgi:hypothetical protein